MVRELLTLLQQYFVKELEQELQEHPELNDLEDYGSQKDTSAPPTTTASTPQPRIKLNLNSANNTNGGPSSASAARSSAARSSAARSDDGDDV